MYDTLCGARDMLHARGFRVQQSWLDDLESFDAFSARHMPLPRAIYDPELDEDQKMTGCNLPPIEPQPHQRVGHEDCAKFLPKISMIAAAVRHNQTTMFPNHLRDKPRPLLVFVFFYHYMFTGQRTRDGKPRVPRRMPAVNVLSAIFGRAVRPPTKKQLQAAAERAETPNVVPAPPRCQQQAAGVKPPPFTHVLAVNWSPQTAKARRSSRRAIRACLNRIGLSDTRIEMWHAPRLRVRIGEHELVPPWRVLQAHERNERKWHWNWNADLLPILRLNDPFARYYAFPSGTIVAFRRRPDHAEELRLVCRHGGRAMQTEYDQLWAQRRAGVLGVLSDVVVENAAALTERPSPTSGAEEVTS